MTSSPATATSPTAPVVPVTPAERFAARDAARLIGGAAYRSWLDHSVVESFPHSYSDERVRVACAALRSLAQITLGPTPTPSHLIPADQVEPA